MAQAPEVSRPLSPTRIKEGSTEALVVLANQDRGPGSSRAAPVFYNPAMAFSRDVGVMVFAALKGAGELPSGPVVEGLAATGLRGLRLALEAGLEEVVLNDANPLAVELARANVNLNGLKERVEVTHARLQALLAGRRCAAVDLDPFGTPAPFLDSALQALKNGGVLALTATDLPLLCGAQPKPCRRRYGALPLRGPACAEGGLRLLVGWVVRRAAAYDLGAEPLLGYYEGHHLRAYLRLRRGAGRADRALERLGGVAVGEGGGLTPLPEPAPPAPTPHTPRTPAGPLWLGRLAEPGLLGRMEADEGLAHLHRVARYLELWRQEYGEAVSPVGFYSVDRLAQAAGCGPPSPQTLIQALQMEGHFAAPTHFSPTGVRTTAEWQVAVAAVSDLVPV